MPKPPADGKSGWRTKYECDGCGAAAWGKKELHLVSAWSRRQNMHIEIVKHPIKGPIKGYEVRVVDANGRLIRMFTYPTIESARRAAKAWTAAYGNCPIRDTSGVKE